MPLDLGDRLRHGGVLFFLISIHQNIFAEVRVRPNEVRVRPKFSITDLEALYLWRNPVFRIKKAEKVNFYLRHNFKGKWNLSLDFQRIQIYSIANKNQKRITADTHFEARSLKLNVPCS